MRHPYERAHPRPIKPLVRPYARARERARTYRAERGGPFPLCEIASRDAIGQSSLFSPTKVK